MNHPFTIIPLTIEARGEVISSNINEFRELVREALGTINRDLQTDEQFGQAELDAKALKEAEEKVKSAKDKALADAESLHALFLAMDETSEEIRKARLELETQIKKRKEEVKSEIVEEFLAAFDIDPRDARKHFLAGLQNAIKGKRTVESMRTACRVFQTTNQARIIEARASIERFVGKFGTDLVMDRRELELKGREAVEAELVRRHEAKQAADEAAKLKAEAGKAKAEAAKANQALAEANKPPAAPVVKQPESASVSIPTTSNVVPFTDPAPQVTAISEAEEWKRMTATVIAAFGLIKEHRERLTHEGNRTRMLNFGSGVNALWKEINAKEVAS